MDRAALKAALCEIAPQILPYAKPVWKVLNEARRAGKRILFEGAQGSLLDIDFGTYPFVTSSNTHRGAWRRPARGWGRRRSTSCWGS